jgi:hypothetical protein
LPVFGNSTRGRHEVILETQIVAFTQAEFLLANGNEILDKKRDVVVRLDNVPRLVEDIKMGFYLM